MLAFSNRCKELALAGLMLAFLANGHATVIDVAPSNGKGYFLDQATGLTWMDLNNFFGKTYVETEAALAGTGFRVASWNEVNALRASAGTPVTQSAFEQLSEIMGGTYGSFQPAGRLIMEGAATYSGGYVNTGNHWYGGVQNGVIHWLDATTSDVDLGAWVVQSGPANASVPDASASAVLLALGLTGLLALRRKQAA